MSLTDLYYWRKYTDHIPDDAVVGGETVCNKPTYIGQVPVQGLSGVHPAVIYPDKKSALSCIDGKTYWEQDHILILCSSRQNCLQWVKSTTDTFTADGAVIGGYLKGHLAFVGRVHYQNEIVVGKIVPSGMYFPGKNGVEEKVDHFQALYMSF